MPMRDRLDLLKKIMVRNGTTIPTNIGKMNSIEFMSGFFIKVNEIRTLLNQIRYYYGQIVGLHNDILSSADQNQDVKHELEAVMEFVKRDTGLVRLKLKAIESEISDLSRFDCQNPSVELRIRQTQHTAMLRIFTDLITEYNLAQVEFRRRCKERICRQLFIANRKIDDDELEDMLEQDNVAIFTHEIMTETEQAKKSLEDVEARHADIIKLERSIKDLHEMFLDMAILIEGQGELVDRIEYNVARSQDYIEQAVVDTKDAVKYHGRARKKKIIIAGIIIGVVLIIIAAILGDRLGKR